MRSKVFVRIRKELVCAMILLYVHGVVLTTAHILREFLRVRGPQYRLENSEVLL